jgi:hypothetical protein
MTVFETQLRINITLDMPKMTLRVLLRTAFDADESKAFRASLTDSNGLFRRLPVAIHHCYSCSSKS